MVLGKIFGTIDILIGVLILISINHSYIPAKLIIGLACYLIIKGFLFVWSIDIASLIEIILGAIIILALYLPIPKILLTITAIYLFQKGIFSCLS